MPPFHQQLIDLLCEADPAFPSHSVSPDNARRLDAFARLSPLYRQFLLTRPHDLSWLLREPLPEGEVRDQDVFDEWRAFREDLAPESPNYLPALRTFRRRMSMRIAWRDVNRLQPARQTVRELSLLAELCIGECYQLAVTAWTNRYGEPWDDALDKRARFCVLGLGKLGGRELNFSSDIDLIYLYEGDGYCRKDGEPTAFTSAKFFTKVAETFTSYLQEQTANGFLFRVDLRLRPEGARSALVRSFAGMENYYAAAGQSWERLALIKARPVAGDFPLGGELLESLHSFRYPRHPPPSLLTEIAAMKIRTEKEVVGTANLRRDLKSGYGGIREIEFIVQTMQLLHAGRFPFLQTGSTIEGLDQLVRYELMNEVEAKFLKEAYWYLRCLEHRLQIPEEQQTHSLPSDPEQLALIAESFGQSSADLEKELDGVRDEIRSHYDELLQGAPVDEELQDWWLFFSEEKLTPQVEESLRRWFGDPEETFGPIRDFVQGNRNFMLTREQVSRFTALVKRLDRIMPQLAFPLATLRRISRFAEFYGTRSQFLSACSLDPNFFEILALLFDRSEFIYELLCQQPEILDEVLRPEILKRRKSVEDTVQEMTEGAPPDGFENWLWLYVKAEQIRIAISDLLNYLTQEETEENLSALADAVLTFLMKRLDPSGNMLVVALGKYGGEEMSFGSDLDLLFIGTGEESQRDEKAVRRLAKSLSHRSALGSIYETDLRLRPHGNAGPLVPTLSALRKYFQKHAQGWEEQVLARARVVQGNPRLKQEFEAFLDELIYQSNAARHDFQALWNMRMRIERERGPTSPPQRAFKTGPGGLIELEFFGQFLQLRHGHRHASLREPNTRRLLRAIGDLGLMDPEENEALLDNLRFLKRVEVLLRRNRNATVASIGKSPQEQFALARWSGFKTRDAFWEAHCRCMATNRQIIRSFLSREFAIETGGA